MLGHMHKLKKEIDLSFLTGRKLTQVAIGLYQVEFQVDEDVTVSVEAQLRYFAGQDEWLWRQEPCSAQVAARTVAVLEASVTSFAGNENGTWA